MLRFRVKRSAVRVMPSKRHSSKGMLCIYATTLHPPEWKGLGKRTHRAICCCIFGIQVSDSKIQVYLHIAPIWPNLVTAQLSYLPKNLAGQLRLRGGNFELSALAYCFATTLRVLCQVVAFEEACCGMSEPVQCNSRGPWLQCLWCAAFGAFLPSCQASLDKGRNAKCHWRQCEDAWQQNMRLLGDANTKQYHEHEHPWTSTNIHEHQEYPRSHEAPNNHSSSFNTTI